MSRGARRVAAQAWIAAPGVGVDQWVDAPNLPVLEVDPEATLQASERLRVQSKRMRQAAVAAERDWRGLPMVFRSSRDEALQGAFGPIVQQAWLVRRALRQAADALKVLAEEAIRLRPIRQDLRERYLRLEPQPVAHVQDVASVAWGEDVAFCGTTTPLETEMELYREDVRTARRAFVDAMAAIHVGEPLGYVPQVDGPTEVVASTLSWESVAHGAGVAWLSSQRFAPRNGAVSRPARTGMAGATRPAFRPEVVEIVAVGPPSGIDAVDVPLDRPRAFEAVQVIEEIGVDERQDLVAAITPAPPRAVEACAAVEEVAVPVQDRLIVPPPTVVDLVAPSATGVLATVIGPAIGLQGLGRGRRC